MSLRITHVDAFSDRPFAGNQAAVCLLPEPREAAWMQALAAELSLSETSFLVRRGDAFDLRWFTPETELDLCGHGTLAAAHVLWEEEQVPTLATARFNTRAGLLTAERDGVWINLDFPARRTEPAKAPEGLIEAMGTADAVVNRHGSVYLLELESEAAVRAVRPNFTALRNLPVHGAIVTARGTGEYDCVSRYFAPAVGINEDPVTGSAHCSVGPYWSARLGKAELRACQASKRSGVLRLRMLGDRVQLGGQAVSVLRGTLV